MLLETFWWRWNVQTSSHNTARFFPLRKCLAECHYFFSVQLAHLHANWDLIGANDDKISEHLNLIFPLAKSPNLEESLFCSCWMLPKNLFCDICQSPNEGEDFKQIFETSIGEDLFPHVFIYRLTFAHVYVLLSHILPCPCVRYPHIRTCICCSHTFAHVYAAALHSLTCVSCSLTFAHVCDTVASQSHVCML